MHRSNPAAEENATGGDTDTLLDWMARPYQFSAAAMLRAISATDLVKERPHHGQIGRPSHGSILASPEIAPYDPNPDYFFHRLRGSAIIMGALRVLIADRTQWAGPSVGALIQAIVHSCRALVLEFGARP